MAQRLVLEDDLDHSTDNVETITFGFDGQMYDIDLSEANAEQFRKGLRQYLEVARPHEKRRNDLDKVRAWARSQGIEVSDRGRVAATILAAYDAGH